MTPNEKLLEAAHNAQIEEENVTGIFVTGKPLGKLHSAIDAVLSDAKVRDNLIDKLCAAVAMKGKLNAVTAILQVVGIAEKIADARKEGKL